MLGHVIVRLDSVFFYDGMNNWKKDIRDAKIYHTEKGASNTAVYKFKDDDFIVEIRPVNIELV